MLQRFGWALALIVIAAMPAWALEQSQQPTAFSIPWANSAGSNYVRTIPVPSQIGIQNCAASLTDGFPPLTFVPAAQGGCAPFGQDFNGILKQITQWSQWQAAGNPIFYSSAFSAAIGGYPKGATLQSASVPGCFWVSSVDNNASDPDTGGANWANTCSVFLGIAGTWTQPQTFSEPVTLGSPATDAQIWDATLGAALDAGNVFGSAGSPQALSGTVSITPNFSVGINFSFLATNGTNYTLNNPTNMKAGQTGCIYLSQPASGYVVTISFGNAWYFVQQTAPVLTPTLGALDLLCYQVGPGASFVVGNMLNNVGP